MSLTYHISFVKSWEPSAKDLLSYFSDKNFITSSMMALHHKSIHLKNSGNNRIRRTEDLWSLNRYRNKRFSFQISQISFPRNFVSHRFLADWLLLFALWRQQKARMRALCWFVALYSGQVDLWKAMWQQSRRRAQTNRRDQGQSGKLSTRSCVQSFPSAFAFLFEVALFFVNLPIVGRTFVCFRRRFCCPAQVF